MDLLNLDSLVGPKRQVSLFGKTYDVADQSVGQMIEAIRMEKAVQKSDDPEAFLSAMQSVVREILPDIPEADLRKMTLRQITAVVEFTNASDRDVVENATTADDPDSEKKL